MGRIRGRRKLERELAELREAVAEKERQLQPSAAALRARRDEMIVGLRLSLEAAGSATPESAGAGPADDDMSIAAMELFEMYVGLGKSQRARQRKQAEESFRRRGAIWCRALRGPQKPVEKVEKKKIPMSAAAPSRDSLAAGFSEANAADGGYGDSELHGPSEASIWREAVRRYGD